jgi:UDP-N-acetylglucosamine--dolichyl-phosphate N-acetylglucosaminephosphotransferase
MESLTIITVACLAFSVLSSFFMIRYWIGIAKRNNLVGRDVNKYKKRLIPESGGIVIMVSIIISIFLYIFFKTFILQSTTNLVEILAMSLTLLLASFVGFVDDILGWKKGIPGWKRLFITVPIAIPLMIINAGHSVMNFPFLGELNLGIIYSLIIIPLGLIGATNGYNLLAGYNGLESGLGIVILSILGFVAYLEGQYWLALIGGIMVISLIVFYCFNQFPARIFPGDSLTFGIGAAIACFAILGNMERVALILFIPFMIEGALKIRSKFKADNFGIPQKDGSLKEPYKKTYSLTHLILKVLKKIKPSHKAREKDVTYSLIILEIILAVIVLIYIF